MSCVLGDILSLCFSKNSVVPFLSAQIDERVRGVSYVYYFSVFRSIPYYIGGYKQYLHKQSGSTAPAKTGELSMLPVLITCCRGARELAAVLLVLRRSDLHESNFL